MITLNDVYRIGTLGKPHGVKGEIAFSFDDDIFDREDADYLFVMIDGLLVPFFIEEYRFSSDVMALMKFDGIDSLDQAMSLTGCDVDYPRDPPANRRFVVSTHHGVLLIPASHELIKKIDKHQQTITVAIPDGLLEI